MPHDRAQSVVHFSIAVSDLDASRKFYNEILGLTLVQATPAIGMVFLRAGHDHVILAKSDAPLQRDAKDSRRAHHAFKVDPEKYDDAKPTSPLGEWRSSKKKIVRQVSLSGANSTSTIRRHRNRVHGMGWSYPARLN